MSEIRYDDPLLCYVHGQCAYFTTRPLELQTGDDWNDVPFEHNAGSPYEWREGEGDSWEIVTVYFVANLEDPAERFLNSPFSVDQINRGETPWLRSPEYVDTKYKIMAGCSLTEFKRVVKESGGRIWVEEK